jgi:hypothetical protein
MAWQYDRTEQDTGMIQAFRRAENAEETFRVKLRGLKADATYTVTDFDVAGSTDVSGHELMENGLLIAIKNRPGAAVITYQKKSN